MKMPLAAQAAFDRRQLGRDRTGMVDLRSFDEGMVLAIGGRIANPAGTFFEIGDKAAEGNYYFNLPNVSPPPGLPGIPITFAYPEDIFEKYYIPAVIVRRDDVVADMARWHPGAQQYKTTGIGAIPLALDLPNGTRVRGFSSKEYLEQAEPVDLLYTVSILAKHRQGIGARSEVNAVFKHVLRIFQAYGQIPVIDSIGDLRTYEAFREGVSMLDDLSEVSARMVGFAVTVRVEAELDLADPVEVGAQTNQPAVTKLPSIALKTNVD